MKAKQDDNLTIRHGGDNDAARMLRLSGRQGTQGGNACLRSNKETEYRSSVESPNRIQLSICSRCLTPKSRTVTCCTITTDGTMGYLFLTKVWACFTASS